MTAGEHDVIVVGSGHNALIAAAYLGVSGLNVLVLEEQARAGGNTMTEELTLPGFLHDSCSTAHTLLQANPLMQRNELQLSERGLRYILPDPAFVVAVRGWRQHHDAPRVGGHGRRNRAFTPCAMPRPIAVS